MLSVSTDKRRQANVSLVASPMIRLAVSRYGSSQLG